MSTTGPSFFVPQLKGLSFLLRTRKIQVSAIIHTLLYSIFVKQLVPFVPKALTDTTDHVVCKSTQSYALSFTSTNSSIGQDTAIEEGKFIW